MKLSSFEDWYPTPDFKKYLCKAGIDFVTIVSTDPLDINRLRTLGARVPPNPDGPYRFPHVATLHDATRKRFDAFAAMCPNVRVVKLEIFADFQPRLAYVKDSLDLLHEMRAFVLSRLYPWGGRGIQVAVRYSNRRGRSQDQIPRDWFGVRHTHGFDIRSSIPVNATTYFGHSDTQYADPALENLASVRAYLKTTDQGRRLPPARHRVRVEAILNELGCARFGLGTVEDIVGFDFRRLADYFRMVEPASGFSLKPKTLRRNPGLFKAVESIRRADGQEYVRLGAHVAGLHPHAQTGRRFGHPVANRKIQSMLDNLSKSYA